MIWTLIIVAYLSDGPAVAMYDFPSQAVCVDVGAELKKRIAAAAWCIQKQTDSER